MSKNKNTAQSTPKRNLPKIYKIAALVIIAVVVIYFILINVGSGKKGNDEEYMFRKDGELTIFDSSGTVPIKIDIQVAQTEFDRELGLMFRKNMNENQGMLFIFPDVQIRNFWMRNTIMPLDIIFIDEAKTIINIARNTTPLSDASYPSDRPAKYVLEVNAGFSDRHKVTAGAKINWVLNH